MANRGSLWTMDGEVPLRERDVIPLTEREVRMLSWLHQWAADQQVNIFCKRCERPITGANNDDPNIRSVSVACQCRTWVFQR